MDEITRDLEDRAYAAEDDLAVLRLCIRELQEWLACPIRGPVIYRLEVIERLSQILAQ